MKSKLEQLKQRVKALEQVNDINIKFQKKHQFNKVERDELLAEAITELAEQVNKENVGTIIVSIGSGNAPKQQNPDFLRNFGKATVLNIDNSFMDENSTIKDNINIEYIPSVISSQHTPKAYTQLKNAISNWTHSGKKVLFMDHTFPGGYNYFKEIIRENLDVLGSTFSYIGSYHQNQPVVVYSDTFLDKNKGNDEEKESLKKKLWASGKTFTSDELHESLGVKDYSYGNFYCDLNLVDPNNLFPKKNNVKKEIKDDIRNNEEIKKIIPEAVKKIKEFKYEDFDLQKQNTKQHALYYKQLVKEKFHIFMNSSEMISAYSLGDDDHKDDFRKAYKEKIKEIDKASDKHIADISYVHSVSALVDIHYNNQNPSSNDDEKLARKLQEEELINAGFIKN